MSDVALVTDDDLARAKLDPAFQHQLVADSLELLLAALNTMRVRQCVDGKNATQLGEGVDLAVKRAELLHGLDTARTKVARGRELQERLALAFSPEIPINPASARSRPGAERTAAGSQSRAAGPDGPASRVPAF